jgi:hypothetical protein
MARDKQQKQHPTRAVHRRQHQRRIRGGAFLRRPPSVHLRPGSGAITASYAQENFFLILFSLVFLLALLLY